MTAAWREPDRPPVIERLHPLQVAAYRRMTSAQRIEAAFDMLSLLRGMITEEVRTANPEWSEAEVRHAVAARFLRDAG